MRSSLVRFSFALAILGLGGSISSCQRGETDTSNIATGTETNWLKACDRDQDCGALSCECGVCTERCDEARACGLSGAVCSSGESAALNALCSTPAPGLGLCLPACDESCGAGLVCLGDACVPANDGGTETNSLDPGTSLTRDLTEPDSNDPSGGTPSSAESTISNQDSGLTSPAVAPSAPVNAADASSPDTESARSDAGNDCSPDSQGTCGADCDFDSCHPERCDEIGEGCCDPLPSDGPNYCNSGLECVGGACAERAGTTTPEALERESCENTGGEWVFESCGHYVCGLPPACAAVIPGCNCGAGRSFGSLGCWDQPDCPAP